MSSPLFRWKFESPKTLVQRTYSEETFFGEAEKVPDGIREPNISNEDMNVDTTECSRFSTQRDFINSGGLSDAALSQGGLTPLVPILRNSTPSEHSTSSTLDFPDQNNSEKPWLLPEERNDFDLGTPNSQVHNWKNDSQMEASPSARKKTTVSSNETVFKGEDEFCAVETGEENCGRSLLQYTAQKSTSNTEGDFKMSQEILTGLDDTQFNAYPTDRNSQAPSTDATFFEKKTAGEVDRGQLHPTSEESTSKAPKYLEMSQEILTGLNDSQFNAYPKDRNNSQTPSTDAKYFEEKVEQIDVRSGSQLRSTSHKSRNAPEDLEMSDEILTGLSDSHLNVYRTDPNSQAPLTDATFFDLAGKRNEAYAIGYCQERGSCGVTNNVAELPKASASVSGRVPAPLDQNLSPSGTSCVSPEPGACSEQELSQDIIDLIEDMPAYPIFDLTSFNNIMEMLENTPDSRDFVGLSPTLGETAKIFNELNLTVSPNPSGSQSSPTKDTRQVSLNQVANKQKRVFSPQNIGERKKRRTNDFKSAEQVGPSGKPPLSRVKKAKKTGVPLTPCHTMSLRRRDRSGNPKYSTWVCLREKISSQERPPLDPGYVGPESPEDENHKNSLRRTSPRIGKLKVRTHAKLFRGEHSSETEDVVDHFWAQLSRDETYLRNIRRTLLDVIFDDVSITREEAEDMREKIRGKQERIRMWNKSDVEGEQVHVQVKELEALCENLLRQIESILADFSSGEGMFLPVPEANYVVSQRSKAMSVSLQPEIISGRSPAPRKAKLESKKSNLREVAPNRHRTKQTPLAKKAATAETKRQGSREVFSRVCRYELPRCTPVVSSPAKACVDIGTNTDFVEPHNESGKKILVDRSTNTDPEDMRRGEGRKVIVDCGTNTGADLTSLQVGRKVLSSVNKENIEAKLDIKKITRVWLPRLEDFVPCSYEKLSPEFFENPNAELPQELLDDLTWED